MSSMTLPTSPAWPQTPRQAGFEVTAAALRAVPGPVPAAHPSNLRIVCRRGRRSIMGSRGSSMTLCCALVCRKLCECCVARWQQLQLCYAAAIAALRVLRSSYWVV